MAQVAGLFVYPVKGMRGRPVEERQVQYRGLRGDRRWLVTDPDGEFMTQRDVPELAQFAVSDVGEHLQIYHREAGLALLPVPSGPTKAVRVWQDTVQATDAGPMAEQWVSKALNRPAKLFHMPDSSHRQTSIEYSKQGDHVSFADGFPLLVTSSSSLDVLNGKLETPIGMDRFRSNIVVEGLEPFEETRWATVLVGEVRFRVVKPCGRCIVTTTDQLTGQRMGAEPVATLTRDYLIGRAAVFGMNLIPEQEGRVNVGDPVSVEYRTVPW